MSGDVDSMLHSRSASANRLRKLPCGAARSTDCATATPGSGFVSAPPPGSLRSRFAIWLACVSSGHGTGRRPDHELTHQWHHFLRRVFQDVVPAVREAMDLGVRHALLPLGAGSGCRRRSPAFPSRSSSVCSRTSAAHASTSADEIKAGVGLASAESSCTNRRIAMRFSQRIVWLQVPIANIGRQRSALDANVRGMAAKHVARANQPVAEPVLRPSHSRKGRRFAAGR